MRWWSTLIDQSLYQSDNWGPTINLQQVLHYSCLLLSFTMSYIKIENLSKFMEVGKAIAGMYAP